MQVVELPLTSASAGSFRFHTISESDRARTSGPGLRAFVKIADRLGLNGTERIAILGHPARSTYYRWIRKAYNRQPLTLPLDTLLRVSAMLGIFSSLSTLFEDVAQAKLWFEGPHEGPIFVSRSPMRCVLDDGLDGLMTVRRYLDAWCSGNLGSGGQSNTFTVVAEHDLVFV